ncbi:hypothetical protein B296_00048499, partial [Ensete ventricosum]
MSCLFRLADSDRAFSRSASIDARLPFALSSSTWRCSARDWASAAWTSVAATTSGFPPPSGPRVLGAEGSDASCGSNTPQIYVVEASSLCQTGVPCVSGLRSGSRGVSEACSGRRLVRGIDGPFSPGGSIGLVRGFTSILLLLADRISPRRFREASGAPLASPMGISYTLETDPDSTGGIDRGGGVGAGTEGAVPGRPPPR